MTYGEAFLSMGLSLNGPSSHFPSSSPGSPTNSVHNATMVLAQLVAPGQWILGSLLHAILHEDFGFTWAQSFETVENVESLDMVEIDPEPNKDILRSHPHCLVGPSGTGKRY